MRVLHYCSRVRQVAGGAERQLARLVRAELVLGAHVEAISPEADTSFPATVHRLGVDATGRGGLTRLMWSALLATIRLRHEFDVVHVHGVGPVATAVVVGARLGGLRSVTGLRSSGPNADWLHVERLHGGFVGGALWRLQFFCSTALAVKTPRMADELRALGVREHRIHVVPNGIDTRAYADLAPPTVDRRTVVYLGRLLLDTKGLDVLAAAWRAFSAADVGSEWVLRLHGDGPDAAAVHELFSGLENAHVDGPADEVGQVLASSTAVVLPSRAEGFSNVLLEALAAGRPVLGTRVSGTEDVLDAACGWLAEPGDADGLAACFVGLALLDDKRLAAMSAAARERAAQYRIEDVAQRWISLYERISGA